MFLVGLQRRAHSWRGSPRPSIDAAPLAFWLRSAALLAPAVQRRSQTSVVSVLQVSAERLLAIAGVCASWSVACPDAPHRLSWSRKVGQAARSLLLGVKEQARAPCKGHAPPKARPLGGCRAPTQAFSRRSWPRSRTKPWPTCSGCAGGHHSFGCRV